MSNIKAYQSETVSLHSPSQNSCSFFTPDCLFTLLTQNADFTDWMVWRVL